MGAHAKLSPSSAHRWMRCPGSIRMSVGIEVPPSVYADEGSAAHYLAETCLHSASPAEKLRGRIIKRAGSGWSILQPNAGNSESAIVIDDDMVNAVQVYLDTVQADAVKGAQCKIEQRISLTGMDIWGTSDFVRIIPFVKAQVYDYKHGAGVSVEAEWNPQLMIYAAGAIQDTEVDDVEIIVVQPRARHKDGPVRRWALKADDLRRWVKETLEPASKLTTMPEAPLNAGEWCRFCPPSPVCPAVRSLAVEVAKADFQTVELPAPDRLTAPDIVRVLQSSEILKSWLASVEVYAQTRMEKGEAFPGFKLVRKRTNRKWINETQAAERLKGQPVFETKLMSPSKVEKLRIDIDVSGLIERPEGGLTIAPESDRREAVSANSLITDFIEDADFLQ